ncbi:MAG: hypothetical protein KA116_08950 [Proteobacteria bacterium]|nr:hypothetical protein [Pseudomonadota bacterium]
MKFSLTCIFTLNFFAACAFAESELIVASSEHISHCETALSTVASDQKLTFGEAGPASDIEAFLKTLSTADREFDAQLALEIKTLIESSTLFTSGLVAHFFLEEAEDSYSKTSKQDRVEFVNNFHLLTARQKMEISFSVVMMVADFFDEFLLDNEDAPKKMKLSEAEFLRMKNFWPQFTKGDPQLKKLLFALLVYFQYYSKDILKHVKRFNSMWSGYKKSWLPFEGFGYELKYYLSPTKISKLLFNEESPEVLDLNNDSSLEAALDRFADRRGHPGSAVVYNFVISHTLMHLPLSHLRSIKDRYSSDLDASLMQRIDKRIDELHSRIGGIDPLKKSADEALKNLEAQKSKSAVLERLIKERQKQIKELEPKLAAIQEEIDDLNPRSAAKTVKLSSDNWGLLEKNLLKHARFMDLEKFLTGIFTLITSNEIKKSEDKKDWTVNLVLRVRAIARVRFLELDTKLSIIDRLKAKVNFYIDPKERDAFYAEYLDPKDWGASGEFKDAQQLGEVEKGLRDKLSNIKTQIEKLEGEIIVFDEKLLLEDPEQQRLDKIYREAKATYEAELKKLKND